jgi:hypothetical protein
MLTLATREQVGRSEQGVSYALPAGLFLVGPTAKTLK